MKKTEKIWQHLLAFATHHSYPGKVLFIVFALFYPNLGCWTVYPQHPYHPILVDPLSEPWRWKEYPELIGKGIRCIAETNDGSIWFGIDKGIITYNGKNWHSYGKNDGLDSIPVNHLSVHKGQTVFAGTDSGLFRFSNHEWERVFPSVINKNIAKLYSINSFRILPDGSILASIGTDIYGALLYLGQQKTIIFSSQRTVSLLKGKLKNVVLRTVPDNLVFDDKLNIEELFTDKQERIWASTRNGFYHGIVFCYNWLKNNPDSFAGLKIFTAKDGVKHGKQTIFSQASNGHIWLVNGEYNIGISIYDGKNWKYFEPSKKVGGDDLHTSILETHDGTLWIGGYGILYSIKNGVWNSYKKPSVSIPNARLLLFEDSKGYLWVIGKKNEVFQLDYSSHTWNTFKQLNFQCQDRNQRKWFLSVDGQVVIKDGDTWSAYGKEDGVPEAPVRLFLTSKNILWLVGSHQQSAATAYFDGNKWVKQLHADLSWGIDYRAVFEDKEGNLWFGGSVNANQKKGQEGGILKLEGAYPEKKHTWIRWKPLEMKKTYFAYGIGQSIDGNLWFGGSHLVKFNGTNWESILYPDAMNNHLEVIVNNPNGMLWVGSRNYGVYRFDGENWSNFDVNNGLTSNSIISILPVSDNNVWVASDMDICRFDGRSWTLNLFPQEMTLTREGGDLKTDHDGILWINQSPRDWKRRALCDNKVSDKVFQHFQAISYKPDSNPPQTTIKEYSGKVSHFGNNIISWEGSDYWKATPNTRLAYSYRLNGGEWSGFKEKTYETFMGLKSGNYVFEVKARDLDFNIDPTPAKISFEVLPPIWRQLWFLMLILFFLSIIAAYEYKAIKHSRSLARLNKSLSLAKIQLEEQKEQILEQNKRERESNQLKLRFFTSISHEFRTPLTLILGSVEKITETNPGNEKNALGKYLQTLQRSSQQLLRLINQLMDFRKLETESMTLKVSKGNIVRYIQNICNTFENLANHYQVTLIFQPQMDNFFVWFDADKVEKIMYNLISNALKFTPAGGTIKVSILKGEPELLDQAYYYILVEDTGLGIPENEIEKIFEPFYQSKVQSVRKYEGTGIGLSLVKSMVKLHYGELKVQSSLKNTASAKNSFTTCFTIQLPCGNEFFNTDEIAPNGHNENIIVGEIPVFKPDGKEKNPETQIDIAAITEKQRQLILIVEDNEDLQKMLFDSLQSQYIIIMAKHGVEGYHTAIEYLPDLIISDIMMPVMNGIEMCHNIKTDQRTSHIPVILLTAQTSDEHKIEGFESGADDYVSKPFNMVLLNTRIRNLIAIRNALRISFRKEIRIQPTNKLVTPIDANFLEKTMSIIEKNIDNPNFDVETLSREIGISSRHLLNKLQSLTDHTPVELIRTLRLKRAEQLLLQRKLTIAEIAYDVGFSDPNYFSKCFAKQYGKPPKEYIESKQKVD